MDSLEKHISAFPPGYSEVSFNGKRHGVTRSDFNGGKSTKIYAEELGGNDFISFNYYRTGGGYQLKPCEMPEEKVLKFLRKSNTT